MNRIELIRWALSLTEGATAQIVGELRDAPLTRPTKGAKGGDGNHPIWTLGHLCVIEGGIPEILFGESNPVEHWKPLFAAGTKPSDGPSKYPSFDELLRKFHELRANTLRILDRLGDAGLDRKPKNVPPGFEQTMTTFGQTLLLISLHNMVHYGQIADVRRVAGVKPLM